MKLLRIEVDGLRIFCKNIKIDFTPQKRVYSDKSEMFYNISSNIYHHNVLAFVGKNASGKTTTLKLITFIIQLLNNESINSDYNRSILDTIIDKNVSVFTTYFSVGKESIYKLETTIKRDVSNDDDRIKYIIDYEKLYEKSIKGISSKRVIFDFTEGNIKHTREEDLEYLPDDVSIIIALNKKNASRILCKDEINWTDFNLVRVFGDISGELLELLDKSIEYLKCDTMEVKGDNFTVRLKFKSSSEIVLNSPLELSKYLSSGTIKGLNVFIKASQVLRNGGYLIVDELENHFNKEITTMLIRLFMDERVNDRGAVIIFSSHYPELLDELERSDNIYIVNNEDGICLNNLASILTRSDIKKSEVYQSGLLVDTAPNYKSYMKFKTTLMRSENK